MYEKLPKVLTTVISPCLALSTHTVIHTIHVHTPIWHAYTCPSPHTCSHTHTHTHTHMPICTWVVLFLLGILGFLPRAFDIHELKSRDLKTIMVNPWVTWVWTAQAHFLSQNTYYNNTWSDVGWICGCRIMDTEGWLESYTWIFSCAW